MSCGVSHRCGSDPVLLWLWCGLAAAAPISPLAWEPPYALSVGLKKKKGKKKLINPFIPQLEIRSLKIQISGSVLSLNEDITLFPVLMEEESWRTKRQRGPLEGDREARRQGR